MVGAVHFNGVEHGPDRLRRTLSGFDEEAAEAALRRGRDPSSVRLMAVTKTVDDDRIHEAVAAGIRLIGENYVQEAQRKIPLLGEGLEWNMIGHLQTNKSKYAVASLPDDPVRRPHRTGHGTG